MTAFSILLALSLQQSVSQLPPIPFAGGRIYTSPTLHVGVRASFFVSPLETASGVTVQISTMWL